MYEALDLSSMFRETYRSMNLVLKDQMLITRREVLTPGKAKKSPIKYNHSVCRVPHVKISLKLIASHDRSQN